MKAVRFIIAVGFVVALMLTGCVSTRSNLRGAYVDTGVKKNPEPSVSVLFYFTHTKQSLGLDAIPKIVRKGAMIDSFDEVFGNSLREISNLGKYATFTAEAGDVNQPERRAKRDSLMSQYDYTIKLRVIEEKKFTSYFFAGFVTTVGLSILPAPYYQSYRLETEVYTRDGKRIATYQRDMDLAKWVETFLIFAYPFYPETQKREEIFLALFHDTFKQIDAERVLAKR